MIALLFLMRPYVYPIREKGYEEELNNFNSKIADMKNFWSIGAAGGFEYSDSQILFRKAKILLTIYIVILNIRQIGVFQIQSKILVFKT